jgi:hypothetical protein
LTQKFIRHLPSDKSKTHIQEDDQEDEEEEVKADEYPPHLCLATRMVLIHNSPLNNFCRSMIPSK